MSLSYLLVQCEQANGVDHWMSNDVDIASAFTQFEQAVVLGTIRLERKRKTYKKKNNERFAFVPCKKTLRI